MSINNTLSRTKRTALLAFALALALVVYSDTSRTRSIATSEMEAGSAQQIRYNALRLRDPLTGEIPRGIRQRERAFAERQWPDRSVALRSAAGIHTTEWASAGPINAGGRTQAVGIDIANESNILLASAQGGMWRSADNGTTWKRTTRPEQIKDIMSLVQDERAGHRNTWYCGTGELLSTTNRRIQVTGPPRWRTLDIGDGIFRSTDSGASWSLLPSTFDATETVLDSAFDGVWNIAVDKSHTDQDILYVAGYGAIMRSSDGGTSWSRVLGDPEHKSFATDVAVTSTGVIYAYLSQETMGSGVSSAAGVWRSIDGIHWTSITPSFWPSRTVRMKVAVAPSNENILYVAGQTPVFDEQQHGIFKYTYTSGDGTGAGGVWEDRSENLPNGQGLDAFNSLGGYALTLKVFPQNENTVFIGGTNLYRSTDGFRTASNTSWIAGYNPDPNGGQSYPGSHPDNHDLAFYHSNPRRAFNANDGGIYRTDDVLTIFDELHPVIWENKNNGFIASILYTVGIDHATPNDQTITGGFQDQGSWVGQPATPWQQFGGGDGCYGAIADNREFYYMSSQFGWITRWVINDNLSWSDVSLIPPLMAENPQFVTPWILDPSNTNVMYFADTGHLWRNSDLRGIPLDQQAPTTTNWDEYPNCQLNREGVISALGASVKPANRLYYGSSDGHVYRLDDASNLAAAPRDITAPIFPKNAFVACVTVDPENADNIFVAFSNYHVRSLFASNDGGTTWRDISGNLEENPDGSGDGPSARWISVVHRDGQTLYLVGTSVGLFSTTDISTSNVTWNAEGLQTIGRIIVEHLDIRQSDGFIAIATQGAGVYTANATTAGQGIISNTAAEPALDFYPNPVATYALLSATGFADDADVTVLDALGRTVEKVEYRPSGRPIKVDCASLPSGNYTVVIQDERRRANRRFVIRH